MGITRKVLQSGSTTLITLSVLLRSSVWQENNRKPWRVGVVPLNIMLTAKTKGTLNYTQPHGVTRPVPD